MKGKFLVFCMVVCIACSSGKRNIIPEKDMVKILKDFHITEAIFSVTRVRHTQFGYVDTLDIHDSIIVKYGYTPAMYDSTIKYYSYHTEIFEELYDKVIEELSKLESAVLDSLKRKE